MRCLKTERTYTTFIELLDRAVYEYNYSIHSTTGQRPLEVFFGRRISTDPETYEKARQDNIQRLKDKQATDLRIHNKNREPIKQFDPGEIVYHLFDNLLLCCNRDANFELYDVTPCDYF